MIIALITAVAGAAFGLIGGFAVGWTACEHQTERRSRRNALPPVRIIKETSDA